MAAYLELFFKKETLETMLRSMEGSGMNVTIQINDESNEWGNNVSAYKAQTKEQRDSKSPKFYLGNGKVYWENGIIKKAVKPEEKSEIPTPGQQRFDQPEKLSGDLPF